MRIQPPGNPWKRQLKYLGVRIFWIFVGLVALSLVITLTNRKKDKVPQSETIIQKTQELENTARRAEELLEKIEKLQRKWDTQVVK